MTIRPEFAIKKNITETTAELRPSRIRQLNDAFRTSFSGGKITFTQGVRALGPEGVMAVLSLVRAFDEFEPGCDPFHEHDFGAVRYADEQLFWKIAYYDASLAFGSPDPADPAVTTRVMTIMLASEY